MELACTKKLLDYIGIKAEKISTDIDPLFAWTANLVIINRRKTLVVVHALSRCGFVLHGLKVKDLPKLPELILHGIRGLLESEYVRPDVIEQYMNDLGHALTFRANSSRKAVAACNKFCERLQYYPELLDPEVLFQKDLLLWLNEELVSCGKDYVYAYETLIGLLRERYGEQVQGCRALELEIDLDLYTPCKRRIIVPDDLTFDRLHHILQKCFEWKDCHLHHFILATDRMGRYTKILIPAWDEPEGLWGVQIAHTENVTLGEVFGSKKKICYEYDFGDGWEHTIRLCRVIEDCSDPYPHCTFMVGDAPMEDCGGPGGYAHILEVLKDETHPEYHEITQWLGGTKWPHWPVNADLISRRIRNAHRTRKCFIW